MEQIYQRFDLDLEAMTAQDEVEAKRIVVTPEAGKALKQGLIERGYEVLATLDCLGGAPTSIIVGGDLGKNSKEDFYDLAGKLGLRYRSEVFYVKNHQSQTGGMTL